MIATAAAGGSASRSASSAQGETEPSDRRATLLLDVFREVLMDPSVTTGTDFFESGGDSMRAIRVVSLAKDCGLGLTVRDVYAAPTVAALAPRAVPIGEDRPLRTPFSELPDGAVFPPDVVDAYPMTALQSGMLYHQEMAPDARIYHIMLSYQVRGVLDPVAFRAAAQAVTDAHPVLRTSFDLASELGPVQRVHTGVDVPFTYEDLTGLDADGRERRIRQVVARETAEDFDLSRPGPFRLVALATSATDYQLVFTHNHVILDGWSVNVFFEDLHTRYLELLDAGTLGPQPSPRTTFGDYVALEQSALADEKHRTFWAERTAGPARLIAPERSGAPVMRQFHVDLSGRLDDLRAVAARLGVPVKALLCAAHLRVVSWLTGSDEVTTSMVFACRPETPTPTASSASSSTSCPCGSRWAGSRGRSSRCASTRRNRR